MPEREGYRVGGIQGQGLPGFNTGGTLQGLLTPNPLQVGQPRLDFSLPDTFQAGQTFPGLNTLASQPDADESGNTNWAKLIALGLGGIAGAALGGTRGALTGLATATGFLQGQRVEGERLDAKAQQASAVRQKEILDTASMFVEAEDLDGFNSFIGEVELENPKAAQRLRAVHSSLSQKAEKSEKQKIFDHSVAAIKAGITANNQAAAQAALGELQKIDPSVAAIYQGLVENMRAPTTDTGNRETLKDSIRGFLDKGYTEQAEAFIGVLANVEGAEIEAAAFEAELEAMVLEASKEGMTVEQKKRFDALSDVERKTLYTARGVLKGVSQFRLALLDPRVVSQIGFIPGTYNELRAWVGQTGVPPEILEARGVLANAIDLMLRGRTGAAITKEEMDKYESIFGSTKVELPQLLALVKSLEGAAMTDISTRFVDDIPDAFDFSDRRLAEINELGTRNADQLVRIFLNPNVPRQLKPEILAFLEEGAQIGASKIKALELMDLLNRYEKREPSAIRELEALEPALRQRFPNAFPQVVDTSADPTQLSQALPLLPQRPMLSPRARQEQATPTGSIIQPSI